MKTCATCKHWTPPILPTEREGSCLKIATGYDRFDRQAEAYTYTRDEQCVTLFTKPDFGCTLHESKEAEPENMPCAKCGRPDLPLHYNRKCPECFTPNEETNER